MRHTAAALHSACSGSSVAPLLTALTGGAGAPFVGGWNADGCSQRQRAAQVWLRAALREVMPLACSVAPLLAMLTRDAAVPWLCGGDADCCWLLRRDALCVVMMLSRWDANGRCRNSS